MIYCFQLFKFHIKIFQTSNSCRGEVTPSASRRRIKLQTFKKILIGGIISGFLILSLAVFLLTRPLWRYDPMEIGIYEYLIEKYGYQFKDHPDGLTGYDIKKVGKGKLAERIYMHPETGGQIHLTRNIRGGVPKNACKVMSSDPEGVKTLMNIAGDFSPSLRKRIEKARTEAGKTGIWVRVNAPDFDIGAHPDWLSLDSRPNEMTGSGKFVRAMERALWRIRGKRFP